MSTDDPIYGYLDKGTRIRHALMSRDWKRKTSPAIGGGAAVTMTPGPGAGRVLVVSKRIIRPGIKARKWTQAIKRLWTKRAAEAFSEAMLEGAKASGHYMGGAQRGGII